MKSLRKKVIKELTDYYLRKVNEKQDKKTL